MGYVAIIPVRLCYFVQLFCIDSIVILDVSRIQLGLKLDDLADVRSYDKCCKCQLRFGCDLQLCL